MNKRTKKEKKNTLRICCNVSQFKHSQILQVMVFARTVLFVIVKFNQLKHQSSGC